MNTEAQSVEDRTRLKAHFDDYKDEQCTGWSSIWEQKKLVYGVVVALRQP